jgi:nucleotide-binding universal stress UspA family protein
MTTIIVGVENLDRSIGAVEFARRLALAAEARLILATAYRHDGLPSQAVYAEPQRRLRERAEDLLALMQVEAGDVAAETRAIADSSPARALHALAEHEQAALIVIGSSHRGNVGRVLAGTTADRLLHGSPCPVAVVPRGQAEQARAIRSILVAYDGTVDAKAALRTAMTAGLALSAAVRVVCVHQPPSTGLGMDGLGMPADLAYRTPPPVVLRDALERFEADLTALSGGARLQGEFVVGEPVEELAKRSQYADLLITGSRGYGPMRAVLIGSVSGRLVRKAQCPVVVVPRGADCHLEQLFVAPPGSRAA